MAASLLGFPPIAGPYKCSSPDASVEGSAGRLAPSVPRPHAGGPGRDTSSAGSPSTTPTSPLMHQPQHGQREQHHSQQKAMEPAGAASATLSAPSATLAAALGLGVPGPAGPGAAAVPAAAAGPGGDGGLGLDLPLLDDFDDLPGLDDLLLDVAAEDPLFADPFAGGLDSPWGSGPKADVPTKPPKPQQPQPQQAASLQAQLPVPRPFATGSPPAEQPFVMVPQQQVQQAQQALRLDRASSADTRRSQTSMSAPTAPPPEAQPPAAAAAAAAGPCRRSAGTKRGSRAATATAVPPPPAASQQQHRRRQESKAAPPVQPQQQPQQQPRLQAAPQAALPVQQQQQQPQQPQAQPAQPRSEKHPQQGAKRALLVPPGPEVFRLPGISLPLLAAEPAVRSTPPAERWVLLDTSSRRPVKRAALGGVGPSPPQLNVAALKLSAAAPLLAAPDAPSLGSQGALADDAKLLRYIFGWWLPAHRPPAQHAAAAGGAQPNQ